jgi:hypothetical protein|tara:strand:- start:4934 stop:5182 length:249 start_codon:yes stop_codon:yes gene_type:complete
MPLSADTSYKDINCHPGKTYFITSDDGSLTVQSIVSDPAAGDVMKSEGTVETGERLRYEGGGNKLRITPGAAGVFWTVTEAK